MGSSTPGEPSAARNAYVPADATTTYLSSTTNARHNLTKEMITMTDEISTPTTKVPKPRKRLIAMLAAVVILAGSITLTSVGVANANAEETARLCAVALSEGASATGAAKAFTAAATEGLEAAESTTLPADAGTSTSYADRPAVAAVEAVRAVGASEGVAAVTGIPAIKARASGADFIGDVTDARGALVKIKISTECTERDEAAAVAASTEKAEVATAALDASVKALTADFAVFQANEAARIAAEIEAARIAAEQAAAAEAARIAAEQAAAEAAASYNSGSGYSGDGSSGGSSGGGGGGGGRPSGGGQVGPGIDHGLCWTSDGTGGQKPCGT
ncbi:MAG TPA: hypothetical protein VEX88_11065 [Glaciibacter sp.]|nr:hypothetical protein [Glaciibacter sp.]